MPQLPKPQLDRVLAQHYGFTDEELDSIINYEIKYRMRKNDGGDGCDQNLMFHLINVLPAHLRV